MSKMFDSYNILEPHNTAIHNCMPSFADKEVYNIKGEKIGILAKHGMPIILYFHIDEINNLPFNDFIMGCQIELALLNKNHRPVLSKQLACAEVFNAELSDIIIEITQEESLKLKQESYGIDLRLISQEGFFHIFSETDGKLIVR